MLQRLKRCRKIYFLRPVSIRKVLSDITITNAFCDLDFCGTESFKWNNTLPFNKDSIDKVINLVIQIRIRKSTIDTDGIEFNMVTGRNEQQDMLDALYLINECKKIDVCIRLKGITNRLGNKYADYYNILSVWMRPNSYKLSYFEYIVPYIYADNIEGFYADPSHWSNPKFRTAIELMHFFIDKCNVPKKFFT